MANGILGTLLDQNPGGVLRSFPRAFTSLVATSTTPATLYTASTSKKFVIVSLMAYRNGAQIKLQIGEGTGAGYAQLIPDLVVLSNVNNFWNIDDGGLPVLEFESAATIQTDIAAAASPNDVRLKFTVFEF